MLGRNISISRVYVFSVTILLPATAGFAVGVVVAVAGVLVWKLLTERETPDKTISYEVVLEAADDPTAHIDTDGTVVYSNSAFAEYAAGDPDGSPVEDVLVDYPQLRDQVLAGEDGTVIVENADGRVCYNVAVFPLSGGHQGKLAMFFDVTAEHERRERLEEKNEQLDRFASLISHDLRNPLDVAIGRTNAVRELNEDPELDGHLKSTQDALQRMRSIITDVLTLARQGDNIGETSAISLEEKTKQAWSSVETPDVTLEIETDAIITANPDALAHVFENLFRNAVEHAGTETTITVGVLSERAGFYVEDDGPGIPPGDRERLLDAGESGDDAGTGLGLAIVESIAAAHEWELDITDSAAGGARFEFTDVGFQEGTVATQA
jgi:signal transduction histidine kinase